VQGKELQNHLKEMLSHFPVRIIKGKTYVRVRHEGVTKGALVEHIIKHYNTRGGVDFILALGDDVADVDMFEVIAAYHRDAQYRMVSNSQVLKEVKVFTCCVGRQPSVANHCLYSAEEVMSPASTPHSHTPVLATPPPPNPKLSGPGSSVPPDTRPKVLHAISSP
jgi:trehalose-phosphatase